MLTNAYPVLGALALLIAGPWAGLEWGASTRTVWIAALVCGAALLFGIEGACRRSLLTDERGRWSLARLQLLVWTWLLLSTFWTIVAARIHADLRDPVAVELDKNLWLLLGVNATSFVGSSFLVARKTAVPGALHSRALMPGTRVGGLTDLFLGEDSANSDVIDIGRVQMFFFTVVAVVVYAAAIASAMGATSDQLVFPQVSESFVALLAISHTAYLVNKIPERTPIQPKGA